MPSRRFLLKRAVNILLLPVLQVVHPGPIFSAATWQFRAASSSCLRTESRAGRGGNAVHRAYCRGHGRTATGWSHDRPADFRRLSELCPQISWIASSKGRGRSGPRRKLQLLLRRRCSQKIERIPLYRSIRYVGIYPGIDAVFHGNHGKLEYDFEIAPGTDPQQLRIDLARNHTATVNADGSLEITSNKHSIRLLRPRAFQSNGAGSADVGVVYSLVRPHEVGFRLDGYDAGKKLVIDPVVSYAQDIVS